MPSTFRMLCGLGLFAAVLSGCGPSERVPMGRWEGLVHPDEIGQAGLKFYWDNDLYLLPGESVAKAWLLDENIYFLTDTNHLYAVDAATGLIRWDTDLAKPDQTVFRPVHADQVSMQKEPPSIVVALDSEKSKKNLDTFDAVVINTLSDVFVFDRATGTKYRQISFDFAANTAGAVYGTRYYVGAVDGSYHMVYLREAAMGWQRGTNEVLMAPLEVESARVYVGGMDEYMYAVEVQNKPKKLWTRKLDGGVRTEFHVGMRGCFVPCEDYRLYGLDPSTGDDLWSPVATNGPLRNGVQVSETTVYAYAQNDHFYAVDLANGRVRWKDPAGRAVLAVMDKETYLLDNAGQLQVRNQATGQTRLTLPLTGLSIFARNTRAPGIYAATPDGRIYCIRQADAGHLTAEMLKTAGN